MAYYNNITSEALFARYARGGAESFDALYQSADFETGVSRWGTAHLFASRVICAKPRKRLALFSDDFPDSASGVHDCIDRLIDGPTAGFKDKFEHQIVQLGQPDSLGYVWAALARLLQAEKQATATKSDITTRLFRPATQHQGYVSSASMQVGSSSPTRPGSGSDGSTESLDWVNKISSAPLEDLTVRLASCFIRCVINYAQPIDKAFPIYFRDERLAHIFENSVGTTIEAIDDGGLQIQKDGDFLQVAMIEGKRAFQMFTTEGEPTVSDNTLGQLVGQALALRRAKGTKTVAKYNYIIILAVTHYMKFFQFHITKDFINEYEKPSPTTDYLRVDSTEWFDINKQGHRKEVVKHILAMLAWADEHQGRYKGEPGDSGDDRSDSDESMWS